MKKMIPLLLLVGSTHLSYAGSSPAPANPQQLIAQSIAAMGGQQKLAQLHTLRLTGIGHTYLLEQSERPEGPWIVNYTQVQQLRDYEHQRLRTLTESRNTQQPEWAPQTTVYAAGTVAILAPNGQLSPGRSTMADEAEETLQQAPEQVLLLALKASDLRALKDTVLQGVLHHGVAYSQGNTQVRLYLNTYSHLPTLLQTTRAYPQDLFWAVWGNVRSDQFYSLWSLTPEGIQYPLQYNLYRNNQPYKEFTILTLALNPALPADTFAIPEQVQQQFAAQPVPDYNKLPLGRPDKQPQELAPGVLQIPGYWNVALIKQEDGVILLEAPISGGYTAQALAKARELYPDLKVKAVISTSDAWPHVAGVREAVAQKLPVYTLNLNKPLLERLIAASFPSAAALPSSRKYKPNFKTVAGKTVLGKGSNRLELYPIRGESGERMVMVYFPEHQLLYASDLAQQNRDGSFFQPAYIAEVVAAIRRENLQVKNVFAMHTGLLPYAKLLEAAAVASVE
ncbi:hypothetical protein [Pontibacter liquoris]|uniref:hypothetical protein n=1 Tax=Pontibacter liquoris TaxID=2905677 RepID=UPI001FA770FD|nr:hypothetical protein [Pontibacter liquoris]